ncbi:MAG: PAS domain S-box protein [Verrucomicrobiae bacterium]|nr:PAS domain S-box protein [Verrucomicrobiae bacterium]
MSHDSGSPNPMERPAWKFHARRIALVYCGFSSLWILLSDKAVFHMIPDSHKIEWINIAKGLFFVVVTSFLLWVMMRRMLGGLEQSQTELRESEHQVRTIYDAVNDGIVIVDPENGRVLGANLAACRMFKHPPEQIRKITIREISSGEEPYTFERGMELIGSTEKGERASVEWRCLRSDGSRFWAEVIGQITQLDREPRFLATVRDVTERHHAEQEIRESRARLRALITRLQETREVERTRISREVHDVLGQLLTGMKMNLNWLGRRINHLDPSCGTSELMGKLEETEALADSMIESVREISHDLRPGILDDLGLPAAIRFESDRFEKRTGIATRVTTSAEPLGVENPRATQMFRVFQEMLTNVARHSKATEVEIRLDRDNGDLILRVSDNGRGIKDGEAKSGGSLGLMGMSERATLLGGRFHIERGESGGTMATLTLPEYPG